MKILIQKYLAKVGKHFNKDLFDFQVREILENIQDDALDLVIRENLNFDVIKDVISHQDLSKYYQGGIPLASQRQAAAISVFEYLEKKTKKN